MAETVIPQDVRELAERYAGRPIFAEVRFTVANAMADAIMADRAARAPDRDALASAQPEITGLEWEAEPRGDLYRSHTILGTYRVYTYHDAGGLWFWARSFGNVTESHPAVACEAYGKAAAQADYERRIRSALVFDNSEKSNTSAGRVNERTPAPHKGEPVAGWFGENVDAWGAEQWFDRLARAIRTHDAAVVSGDELKAETCRMIASSSAMRLVRDFERVVKKALASPPPVAKGMVLVPREPTQSDVQWAVDLIKGQLDELARLKAPPKRYTNTTAAPNQADGAGE